MIDRYDAIIIGSGISGIGLGALLAQAGRKVLVLEKDPVLGGRAYSFRYRGHIMNIGGPRAGLLDGRVDTLFARLGKEPGERGFFDGVTTWRDGSLVSLPSLVSPQDLLGLYQLTKEVPPGEMPGYDNRPGPEWLDSVVSDPGVRQVARYVAIVMTTIPRLEDIAASALINAVRHGIRHSTTYLTAHGYGDYIRILAEALTEHGGEIAARARAREILLEKNRVKGVRVEVREKDGKPREMRVRAPIVVTAFPIWEIFRILGESRFPPHFVGMAKHLDRPATIFGISVGLREPLFEGRGFIMTDLPRTRHPFSAFMASNIVPTISPEGEHLFECCCQCAPGLGSNKPELEKYLALLRQDLEEMFPGWEEKSLWTWSYFHWVEAARNPGRDGVFRPGLKAPGIEGLYFVGDSTDSRLAPGLECASDSAMRAAEMIARE